MINQEELEELEKKEKLLRQAAECVRVQEKDLPRVIERFKRELKEFEEKIKNFKFEK